MEGGALFNPGFLGGNFLWWVGQIADDSTWKENISAGKIKSKNDTPGWGYRYKVRIIGLHDQQEVSIKSEQLPWAQVMYPITAGGGQGGSFQTPALKQGNFVFGFFLDGQDRQVPVIMGVLGNNATTRLKTKTALASPSQSTPVAAVNQNTEKPRRIDFPNTGAGTTSYIKALKKWKKELETKRSSNGENFTPQSHHSQGASNDPTKKVADKELPTEPPGSGTLPTKESSDAVHQETSEDEKKDQVLKRKHALACPDPEQNSAMKAIQTVIEWMTEKIQEAQKALQKYSSAVSLAIKNAYKDVNKFIDDAAKEIAKHMKKIFGQVQNFVTEKLNEVAQPLLKISPPTIRIQLLDDLIKGFETLCCMFNAFNLNLLDLIKKAIQNILNRKSNSSPAVGSSAQNSTSPQDGTVSEFDTQYNIPPLPPEGYYTPNPICSTEELVGEVLGSTLGSIMSSFDIALAPMINRVGTSLASEGSPSGKKSSGSSLNGITSANGISIAGIASALASGKLVGALSDILAGQLGVSPGLIGDVTSALQRGDITGGITTLAGLAGVDPQIVSTAIGLIGDGDYVGGFASVFGVSSGPYGAAFSAIQSGDLNTLAGVLGPIAGVNPSLLSAITDGNIAGIASGLGGLAGIDFDIGSALGFISSITAFFECDPKPECSPNDTHTLKEGGSGKPGEEKPNPNQVADNATASASISNAQYFAELATPSESSPTGVLSWNQIATELFDEPTQPSSSSLESSGSGPAGTFYGVNIRALADATSAAEGTYSSVGPFTYFPMGHGLGRYQFMVGRSDVQSIILRNAGSNSSSARSLIQQAKSGNSSAARSLLRYFKPADQDGLFASYVRNTLTRIKRKYPTADEYFLVQKFGVYHLSGGDYPNQSDGYVTGKQHGDKILRAYRRLR